MKEIEDLRKAKEAARQMQQVVSGINSRGEEYQKEIDRLRAGLPELLTAVELGEIKKEKADEIKIQIRILEVRIKDIPMILQGLEKRSLLSDYAVRDATRVLEKLYKSMKKELVEGDESVNVDDLKLLAEAIGYVGDLEDCLNKISFNSLNDSVEK